MAKDSAKDEKKRAHGGDRLPAAEVVRRTDELYELFASGLAKSDLKQHAAKQWGMAPRTFEDYWQRVSQAALEASSVDRHEVFSQVLIGLGRAARMAVEVRNPSAVQACLSTIARLSCIDPSIQPIYEDSPRRR